LMCRRDPNGGGVLKLVCKDWFVGGFEEGGKGTQTGPASCPACVTPVVVKGT